MAKRYDMGTWELIRNEYRAGVLSVRDIAKEHGPTEAAIRSRARKENWERDLTEQVRAATRAKLNASEATPSAGPNEIIAAAADRNFKTVQAHMQRLGKLAEFEDLLIVRIVKSLDDLAVFDEAEGIMERMVAAEQGNPKTAALAMTSVFTPEFDRSALLKNITKMYAEVTTAVGKRIQLERQALNIDKLEEKGGTGSGWSFEAVLTGEPQGAGGLHG